MSARSKSGGVAARSLVAAGGDSGRAPGTFAASSRRGGRPGVDSDLISGLVGRVYEGINDLDAWTTTLSALSDALGASCALIYTPDAPPHHQDGMWLHRNLDVSAFDRYVSHYVTTDLWRQAIIERNVGEGQVIADHELVKAETFARSEFFNEFLRPIDIGRGALSVASKKTGISEQLNIGFYRAVKSDPFRDDQRRALDLIVGHFARAWKLRGVLRQARLTSNAADRDLEQIGCGWAVVDKDGYIRSASESATEFFRRRDGLLDTGGQISAVSEGETRQLRAEIASITNNPLASGREAISISRTDGQTPYKVIITRRPNNLGAHYLTVGDAIVLISDSGPRRGALLERHMLAWALTPAEKKVVSEIVAGGSVASHARNRSISIETARWHLKNALAKAGLRSQRDLVCCMRDFT